VDRQTIGGLLHALENLLDSAQNAAVMSEQLIKAERDGKPMAPSTLVHYEEQLAAFSKHRERFRELLAQWWTMFETEKH
jgi:hypothetical protein